MARTYGGAELLLAIVPLSPSLLSGMAHFGGRGRCKCPCERNTDPESVGVGKWPTPCAAIQPGVGVKIATGLATTETKET